jgi:hypothetical protein
MDSYFARQDEEYGTWACNRSIDKGYYHAALDHILVSKELWGEVKACGVHIPTVRWNTDHRMVELDLGPCGEETLADTEAGRKQGEDKSEQAKERAARQNFNKHVLWCRLQLDPDQELPRMREALERLVTKAKMAMLDNLESDPEWEQHTSTNALRILTQLTDTLTAKAEELFPSGVPANNQMKGRHWNTKNREIKQLISKRGQLMLTLAKEKTGGAATARITKLEAKVCRKQRQIRENLRQNRDSYWTEVADRLETAYGGKDMKLYYKLHKEAHGPQLASTTKGRQSLAGQHMKD